MKLNLNEQYFDALKNTNMFKKHGKSKPHKKKKRIKSKQRIVLKLPTMISVCIDKPIFRETEDNSEATSSDRKGKSEIKHKRRKRNKRIQHTLQQLNMSRNRDSRKEMKIKENKVSD